MAKRKNTYRQTGMISDKGRGQQIEQTEEHDDSMLPVPEELAKYKELDNNLVPWLMTRTEKEQDSRIDFDSRKIGLFEKGSKRSFTVDMFALFFAFIIIIVGMIGSYLLIEKNHIWIGSIFGGATLLMAANGFLKFKKDSDKSKPHKK